MAQNGLRMWGGYLRKNCKLCRLPFLEKQARRKYCGPECAEEAWKLWTLAQKRHASLQRRSARSFVANVLAVEAELSERLARGLVIPRRIYPGRPSRVLLEVTANA